MTEIVEKIKVGLQPQGRAIATAASFELFLTYAELDETQLVAALNVLSNPLDFDTEISVVKRRQTLEEIVTIFNPAATHKPSVTKDDFITSKNAIRNGWIKWVAFLNVEKDIVPVDQKNRYLAMLETAERELYELKMYIAPFEKDTELCQHRGSNCTLKHVRT
jgi:hypothetical protein